MIRQRHGLERLFHRAIYCCRDCGSELTMPRSALLHFGEFCRCPRCGTHTLSKLRSPDPIDPMKSGVLNWLKRVTGGHRYHCSLCRVQFFDHRPLAPAFNPNAASGEKKPVSKE